MEFLAFIGLLTLAWPVAGLLLLCFSDVYIARGAPLSAKAMVVGVSMFTLPYFLLTKGVWPGIVLMPDDASPEEQASFALWRAMRQAECNCPSCRERKGQ